MSLLRQLWLIVLLSTLLAFAGGFTVNLTTAKQYLEQQLLTQSADNAASLALSMSQQSKDPAMVELMVSALFDSGHFRLIRYEDVHGRTVIERRNDTAPDRVPAWFPRLLPLQVKPGVAQVSSGWNQAGRVVVVAHERFAYQSLWRGMLTFLLVMAVTGLVSGIAVTVLIRWVRKPLRELVQQAAAIGERNFITMREPDVTELRLVVRTMNAMVDRVKAMFAEQADRIDELRTQANRDAVTGLPNRDYFLGRLRLALSGEEAAKGALLLLRLEDLAGFNRNHGRAATDQYLRQVAAALTQSLPDSTEAVLARLNGADFAVILPGVDRAEAEACGRACLQAVTALAGGLSGAGGAHVGVVCFVHEDGERRVLALADQALAQAEAGGEAGIAVAGLEQDSAETAAQWREMLESAIARRQFTLASFPVLDRQGAVLHQEVLLRLRGADGKLQTAGQFMPMAARLGLLPQLDLIAVELACERLQQGDEQLAVNLAPASIADLTFFEALSTLLARHAAACRRLWLEVNEQGLGGQYERLEALAALVRSHGAKLGVEHFGRQFGRIPALYDLRLDYLKIDGSFIRDIDQQAGNQQLLKAIVGVSGGAGLLVLAEAVHAEAEWRTLQQLGIHGMTGPYATQLQAGR
ncbi:bifunctional diguanylate cyclase/phosphodiesterase [Chitinimonas sp.]|uniref:bifunctional diguanylate cyclase/phosphodiesterase n=1 Tax=Chitinimonas sp. TaxID=1934313 RepID=UPI002F9412A0